MSQLQQDPAPPSPPADASAPDTVRDEAGTEALAHLAKMSGTGSTFGAADYVAINPTAVASLILGASGALALLINVLVFLLLPIAGIVCGLIGIRQIRRSNGTQAGYGFAIAGILVALLMGGLVGGRELQDWLKIRSETREAAAVIARFGGELHGGHFENAYDGLTTADFRERVDRKTFQSRFEALQNTFGPVTSMEYNHEGMIIETTPVETRLTCLVVIRCRDLKDAGREYFRVSDKDGTWKISSIPQLFPEKKGPKGFPQ
ncbi:MAG TPA: DUF4190 domain-containing protein [Tepidisphaeraceae bacterium]|jgi:hypothetical protein|nr:DUF4190 domain-containing protein [Tepidisphaeraceae bacterium]